MSNNTSDLTVVTVVENDSGLIDLMIRSVRMFTSPPPKIIICDNGGNGNLLDKYKRDADIVIINHKPTMGGGSNRHGESLNRVFKEITTPWAAIVESDCIVVSRDWNHVDVNKYNMMASIKGIYKKMPYYYAALMMFDVASLGDIDFRPGNDTSRANRSYKPQEDVAWRIDSKIKSNKIKLMDCVDCKTNNGQFLDNSFQCEEYWVNSGVVAVHFGRGSNLGGKANRKGFDSHKAQLEKFIDVVCQVIGE